MQVLEAGENSAVCAGRNGHQVINTILLGQVEVGQWLMTFLDRGVEIIDPERAAQVNAALDGLQAVANGVEVDLDQYFADLVKHEPVLPDFLKKNGA
jgi:hydrogenase expression/formation protein HypC